MMKKIILYIFVSAYILTSTSCMCCKNDSVRVANEANKTKISKDKRCDAEFAVFAADAGMLGVKIADLVKINAVTPSVKNLGSKMEFENGKKYSELKDLAVKKNITLPDKLSDRSQKTYDRLSVKKGKNLDKAYVKCAKKSSKKELCKFKKEDKKGNDPEIKSWAAANITSIKDQINETEDACKRMKDDM